MKSLICKLLDHKPLVTKKKVFCKRCKKEGFMQKIDHKYGKVIEYEI